METSSIGWIMGLGRALKKMFGGSGRRANRGEEQVEELQPSGNAAALDGLGGAGLGLTGAGLGLAGALGSDTPTLDAYVPPRGRDVLTRARRDNPVPSLGRHRLTEARTDNPTLGGPPKYRHQAPLLSKYRGEQTEATWRPEENNPFGKSKTAHLDAQGRDARRLRVQDGRILDHDGGLLDTRLDPTRGEGGHRDQIFAMAPDGDFAHADERAENEAFGADWWGRLQPVLERYGLSSPQDATEEDRARIKAESGVDLTAFHHSSFFAGQRLGAAGRLQTVDGVLKRVDPKSGHHRPDTKHTVNALDELDERGVNLDHTRVAVYEHDDRVENRVKARHFHAGEVRAAQGDDQTLLAKHDMLGQMRRVGEKGRKHDDAGETERLLRTARGGRDAHHVEVSRPRGVEDFGGRGEVGSDPVGEARYERLASRKGEYAGEHTEAKWRYDDARHQRTAALTDEGRAKRRVQVEDGLLYDADGNALDTREAGTIRADGDDAAFLFAMSEGGDLLASDGNQENLRLQRLREHAQEHGTRDLDDANADDVQHFHHTSYFGGRDLAGAGGLKARDGKLIELTANSGHHKPGNDQQLNVVDELDRRGVDFGSARVELFAREKARAGEKSLGGKRVELLAGGLVQQALGGDGEKTERSAQQRRDDAGDRLGVHMSLLDQIRQLGLAMRSNDRTREHEAEFEQMIEQGAPDFALQARADDLGLRIASLDMNPHGPKVRLLEDRDVPDEQELGSQQARRRNATSEHLAQGAHEQERWDAAAARRAEAARQAKEARKAEKKAGKKARMELPSNPYAYGGGAQDEVASNPYNYGGGAVFDEPTASNGTLPSWAQDLEDEVDVSREDDDDFSEDLDDDLDDDEDSSSSSSSGSYAPSSAKGGAKGTYFYNS